MIITNAEQKKRGIPFWDESNPGDLCAVPCWPSDDEGDALDCDESRILIGVMDSTGVFRAEESEPFDPAHTLWMCAQESGTGLIHLGA